MPGGGGGQIHKLVRPHPHRRFRLRASLLIVNHRRHHVSHHLRRNAFTLLPCFHAGANVTQEVIELGADRRVDLDGRFAPASLKQSLCGSAARSRWCLLVGEYRAKQVDGFNFSAFAILTMFITVRLCSPRSMPPM